MTGKIIAVANMKGGVGKTATVVMLAEALAAAERKPVLVIDVDAQANASLCLAGDQKLATLIRDGRTLDAFLDDYFLGAKRTRFSKCIHPSVSDVWYGSDQLPISLLASSPELRLLEREIVIALTERKLGFNAIVGHLFRLLSNQLKAPENLFSYVLIDCAPGISALTEASIRLADLVIVPTIPDYLSTAGLQAFCNSFWKGSRLARPVANGSTKPRVLITRRRQTREHHLYVEKMRNERRADEPAFVTFKTEVPEATAIAEALGKTGTMPTLTNKWGAAIVPVLNGLVKETLDGMAVLRAIADNRPVFSGVKSEAAKYGRTLVMKQLKAKGSGIETLQAVRTALGCESFSHIVDAMTDAEVKSLVGRVDRCHPEFKTSNSAWRRMHLQALADGKTEPTDKPARATKTKTVRRKSPPKREFLDLQSMKATRQRRS